jgi:hypothetical protein
MLTSTEGTVGIEVDGKFVRDSHVGGNQGPKPKCRKHAVTGENQENE